MRLKLQRRSKSDEHLFIVPLVRLKFGRAAIRYLALAFLAISCVGCESMIPEAKHSDEQPPPIVPALQEMRDLTAAERTTLAESFAYMLNEPESAKFRWAKVPKVLPSTSLEYCGMVNVKNSNGSYDGMQPFLASIATSNGNITGGAMVAINSENREENREVIPKLCRQKGLNPFDAK